MRRQRVFRLITGMVMGVSAAAATAAGFREQPTLWQLLLLVLAVCLTAGGTVLTSSLSARVRSTPDRLMVGSHIKKAFDGPELTLFVFNSGRATCVSL